MYRESTCVFFSLHILSSTLRLLGSPRLPARKGFYFSYLNGFYNSVRFISRDRAAVLFFHFSPELSPPHLESRHARMCYPSPTFCIVLFYTRRDIRSRASAAYRNTVETTQNIETSKKKKKLLIFLVALIIIL